MYPFHVRTSQTCLAGNQNANDNISVTDRLYPLSVPFSRFSIVLVSAKAILRHSANTSEFIVGFQKYLIKSKITPTRYALSTTEQMSSNQYLPGVSSL